MSLDENAEDCLMNYHILNNLLVEAALESFIADCINLGYASFRDRNPDCILLERNAS
jgi:hypothetical protein